MFTLDHVGVIVPSLEKARERFAALGFTLTRRADHTRTNARGEVESAGSSQSSIMFPADYVELQEQTGPPGGHILSAAAEKHPGLHIVAVGVKDAQAAQAEVTRRGLPAGPVLDWGRAIDEPDVKGEARFGFFVLPYERQDESFLCWVQQKTPELVRSPRLVAHENGAAGIAGLILAIPDADDAREIAWRYVAAGAEAVSLSPERAALKLGDAAIGIERRGLLADLALPRDAYQGPRVAALALRFADPAAIVSAARELGLATRPCRGGTSIDLGPDYETLILALRA